MIKTAAIAVLATLLTASVVFNYRFTAHIGELEQTIATQGQTITAQQQQIEHNREYMSQLEGDILQLEDNVSYLMSENDSLRSEVSQLEDAAEYWEDEANTWMEAYYELESLGGYREFGSLRELTDWLRDDPTSERHYSSSYDCDDFAMDLTLAAIRDGYWIGLYSEEDHVMNFTVIGNNVYSIEPQTDHVELWGFVD
ncbi:MAG: hypothetical protein JSW24_00865 [Dehalococcoidia bacterium]|nr:MAG: hypothetical protein JSW24_00865 [Dehalococcoidia bacterium]